MIVNIPFSTENSPSALKTVNVIPIFKKYDHTLCNNYRFILFINDLHKTVEYSFFHNFADNANLLLVDKSLENINKHTNRDLKLSVDCLRANKLLIKQTSKTETVIFKPRNYTITKHLTFRNSVEKIKPLCLVRYLGVILQDDLHWNINLTSLKKTKS